ncbi:hypothetical protein BJ944DRAFT_244273 [Cunninghamella echinulata]|nr:hypothetical protein BJ944DRAFT_244273 [Cunninghamella echinulata]
MPKTKSYRPIARCSDKPDAMYWLILKHPEMTDTQIAKLIGSTKTTSSKQKMILKTNEFN